MYYLIIKQVAIRAIVKVSKHLIHRQMHTALIQKLCVTVWRWCK